MERQNRKTKIPGAVTRNSKVVVLLAPHLYRYATPTGETPAVLREDLIAKSFSILASNIIVLFSIVNLLLPGSVHAAEIYKWVDEKGAVHFEDRPTAQATAKIIIKNSGNHDKAYQDELVRQNKLLEVYTDERQELHQRKEKIREEKQLRDSNCNLARKNLAEIKTASYLYEATTDAFNPRILTAAERSAETTKAEAAVQYWCI